MRDNENFEWVGKKDTWREKLNNNNLYIYERCFIYGRIRLMMKKKKQLDNFKSKIRFLKIERKMEGGKVYF